MSLRDRRCRVHFIGIGGIGMSGIAELLHHLGHKVTGSDLSENEQIKKLKSLGIEIQHGHSEDILKNDRPDVVVYSNAVRPANPEWISAQANGIPVIRRAEMLAELMHLKRGISVAGSHGKTTTTGMISFVLKEAGKEPTVIIGGQFAAFGSNAAWGGGEWLVAESDESDGSFMHLSPEISVVTNIDREHLDHYGSLEVLQKTFWDFIERVPFYGRSVLCGDSPVLAELRTKIRKPAHWYSFEPIPHSYKINILEPGPFPLFELRCPEGEKLFETRLKVPGKHNVSNAIAAALVCRELGLSAEQIARGLSLFEGVARRFEHKGEWAGHAIFEDYGHHPTEIRATLEAAKEVFPNEKVCVVFQPHRYSRTRLMWEEFKDCFERADVLLTLPIYAGGESREVRDDAFDGAQFCAHVNHPDKIFAKDFDDLKEKLEEKTGRDKIGPIFFLGAGDITKALRSFVE